MRNFKQWFLFFFACSALTIGQHSQSQTVSYPNRTVKIIVAYGAGSGADTIARIIGEQLSRKLNGSVVIENQPGAGGAIGTVAAARSAADGYTLLLAPTTLTVSPHMEANPKYDAIKDFTPITRVATLPMVLVSGANNAIKSFDDLVVLAKANPGKLDYATSGKGSPSHLEVALLAKKLGLDVKDISYRTGSQALTDVISGQVSFYFPVLPAAGQQIASSRINALAIGTKKRSSNIPSVPTLGELLKDPSYEASVWYRLLAPAGAPKAILDKLSASMKEVLEMPETRERIEKTGSEVSVMDQKEFTEFIKTENAKWGNLVRELGLKNQ